MRANICSRSLRGKDMAHFAHEWHLAGANFAIYVAICALTFALGGLDPAALSV